MFLRPTDLSKVKTISEKSFIKFLIYLGAAHIILGKNQMDLK